MLIHVTRPINVHQIQGDDLLPRTIQWSMWCCLLIVTTCLSFHRGCIGRLWYAADTSDLKSQWDGVPSHVHMAHKATMRSCRLSSQIAPSDLSIHELRECGPALWSLMSHKFIQCDFRTAETSGLYILGSRSLLKEREYWSSANSRSNWFGMNVEASSLNNQSDESNVVG